jgi:hypothetical protein
MNTRANKIEDSEMYVAPHKAVVKFTKSKAQNYPILT